MKVFTLEIHLLNIFVEARHREYSIPLSRAGSNKRCGQKWQGQHRLPRVNSHTGGNRMKCSWSAWFFKIDNLNYVHFYRFLLSRR